MATTSLLRSKNSDRIKFNESIRRTVDKLEAKEALMAEWEAFDPTGDEVKRLRHETTKLRAQLKNKGVVFDDELA